MKNSKTIIAVITALFVGGIAGAWTYHTFFTGPADLAQQQGTEATKKFFSGIKGLKDIDWAK